MMVYHERKSFSVFFYSSKVSHISFLVSFRSPSSLQNRRDFLHISGEQRRKRGECEARVACEGRSDPPLTRNLRFALAMRSLRAPRSPRARLAFASVPLKYAKNYACSAGYLSPTLSINDHFQFSCVANY